MTDPVSAAAAAAAFRPVNALEERLVAAAQGDRAQQFAFERELPNETLYVATPDAMPEGRRELDTDTPVRLLSISLKDGRRATAVFTSPGRVMAAFGEGTGCLSMPARTLFGMIRADPAVLNPGQMYGVVWEPDVLHALAGMPVERVVEKETQVMLGTPKEIPTELLAALKAALEPVPEVRAAWLGLAYWPGATSTVWHLDVRAGEGQDAIRRALGSLMDGQLNGDRKLDMVINAPGGDEGVGLVVVAPRARAVPAGMVNGKPKKTNGKGLLGRLFGG
ncbi:enhanced serine sensitivity protein SseB C-terminal domain-containing protein [Brevundimonas lenta]|uniref:SseB protein N-terminal domain-containing protein n=1 Tax=Brevundimonas lenta TaxID=424796 RepID=A0A7W6JBI9_9CAUL|nr:enhanced serine sensitivity protein SseB C-terminal domain-containing protein [Brevundimonas lenta]MBB4082071.1 hypothetical protein [Brevundimonas lenta]